MYYNHLKILESEAIFVMREVAAQFERPFLLFSGGKDSIIMAHLARKAFHPGAMPFTFLHIDTGHNFDETIEFRDKLPKTRSGKIVRRILKAEEAGEELGDTSTLED